MDLYEIQRAIQATGVVGLQNVPVHLNGETGPVATAELKYNDEGFPYILLGCE